MKRPIGVTVVAALTILGGVLQSVLSFVVMRVLLASLPPDHEGPETWVVLVSALPVFFGIALTAAGIGVWRLRKWGRLVLIGLCSLVLVHAAVLFVLGYFIPDISIVGSFLHYPWHWLLPWVLCGFCLAYMFTGEVKRAFSA
jgi:hypothetical protein